MQSLEFTPGRAFLQSDSPTASWRVVFEDEGVAGYFYAHDRSLAPQGQMESGETFEQSIVDAMLIYNVGVLRENEGKAPRRRLAAVEWSRDGQQAVLYLDGTAQALFDFEARRGYCRSNFPNFLEESTGTWRRASHAWEDAVLQRFETALYV